MGVELRLLKRTERQNGHRSTQARHRNRKPHFAPTGHRRQLRAMSAGKPRYFTPEELEHMHSQVSPEEVSNRAWDYFSSLIET